MRFGSIEVVGKSLQINSPREPEARTHIQSGNVAFGPGADDTARFAERLARKIGKRHGFEPHILAPGLDQLERAMAENPFLDAERVPGKLSLGSNPLAPIRNPFVPDKVLTMCPECTSHGALWALRLRVACRPVKGKSNRS